MQEAVERISQISGNLSHPLLIGIRRHARKMHAARGQFNHEQHVIRYEAAAGPDLDRKEVSGGDAFPVRFEKCAPAASLSSQRRWLNAMCLEDIADRGTTDLVAEIRQRAPDRAVTPVAVLFGESQDQIDDGLFCRWPSGLCPLAAVIPLPGNQLPVPRQQRVGRDECVKVSQDLAAQCLGFGCQTATLLISEPDSLIRIPVSSVRRTAALAAIFSVCMRTTLNGIRITLQLLPQDTILFFQIFDHLELLAVDPASESNHHNLPWMKD